MSLIKCPECKHTVSSSAISCPNCGFDVKHRKWYSKKYGQYIILIVSLFLIFNMYVFYKNTKGLVNEINETVEYEILSGNKVVKIINQYENLSLLEKPFVYNYGKLKNKKIIPTSDLLKKFLIINIDYSNYKYEETNSVMGVKFYKETVDVDLIIDSKDIKTENLLFNIDLNNGYDLDNKEKFNEKTTYNKTIINDGLLNNSLTAQKIEPLENVSEIKFKNIEGYIYIK